MRLSESKIKQTILHPERDIRSRALRYFSRSYCRDESIMPLVISAVETYDKQDAYHLIGPSRHLKQTEDSILWIIDELNDQGSSAYENYIYNLSMILLHADPAQIVGKESRIIDAPHFPDGWREVIEARLEMLSWDVDTCWRKITEICEEGKDKQNVDDVALGEAGRFVEALGRIGGDCEDRIHACLSLQVHFRQSTPVKWMQPLMIQLAGEVRLESAIPLILDKLETGDDVLMEECECALTKIGTDSAVKEIADRFGDATRDCRLYATGPLEHIHCDLAVETCLRFFPHEQDSIVKKNLVHGALAHFSAEAIEPVRRLLLGRKLSGEERHLRDCLVETCRIMERQFPEYDDWLASGRAERQEHKESMAELRNDPKGMLAYAFERLREHKEPSGSEEHEAPPESPVAICNEDDESRNEFEAEPATPGQQKTGRNDPCPCGSGKKYKRCCLKKQNDGSLFD